MLVTGKPLKNTYWGFWWIYSYWLLDLSKLSAKMYMVKTCPQEFHSGLFLVTLLRACFLSAAYLAVANVARLGILVHC